MPGCLEQVSTSVRVGLDQREGQLMAAEQAECGDPRRRDEVLPIPSDALMIGESGTGAGRSVSEGDLASAPD